MYPPLLLPGSLPSHCLLLASSESTRYAGPSPEMARCTALDRLAAPRQRTRSFPPRYFSDASSSFIPSASCCWSPLRDTPPLSIPFPTPPLVALGLPYGCFRSLPSLIWPPRSAHQSSRPLSPPTVWADNIGSYGERVGGKQAAVETAGEDGAMAGSVLERMERCYLTTSARRIRTQSLSSVFSSGLVGGGGTGGVRGVAHRRVATTERDPARGQPLLRLVRRHLQLRFGLRFPRSSPSQKLTFSFALSLMHPPTPSLVRSLTQRILPLPPSATWWGTCEECT